MSMQSPQDRTWRLEKGCCPVHGLGLTQVGTIDGSDGFRYVVKCPRRDCSVQATMVDPDGAAQLTPEHEHLLHPG